MVLAGNIPTWKYNKIIAGVYLRPLIYQFCARKFFKNSDKIINQRKYIVNIMPNATYSIISANEHLL